MKYGLCCSVEAARKAVELGIDYVEVGAVGFNGLEPTWNKAAYEGLPVEATNVFFPGSIRLFGDNRTPFEDYAKRTVERAAEVGVKVMVIGSGGSRTAPDGYDPLQAKAEFVNVVAKVQEIARPFGIVIAPESLTRLETNVGNDLGRLSRALAAKGLAYTADSFHVLKEWALDLGIEPAPVEGPSEQHWREQIPHAPAHIHIGDYPRNAPKADDPMMVGFARRVKELGYDARISLECNIGELEKGLPDAISELKRLFA